MRRIAARMVVVVLLSGCGRIGYARLSPDASPDSDLPDADAAIEEDASRDSDADGDSVDADAADADAAQDAEIDAAEDAEVDAPADAGEDALDVVRAMPISEVDTIYGIDLAAQDDRVCFTFILEGTVDLGGGPLTTRGGGDTLVACVAPDGALQFATTYGTSDLDFGRGIAVGNDGAVYSVTRFLRGELMIGAEMHPEHIGMSFVVARFDASGALDWAQVFRGDNVLDPSVFERAGDVIVVGGRVFGDNDFGVGSIPSSTPGIFHLGVDASDGHAVWANNIVTGPNGDVFAMGASETHYATATLIAAGQDAQFARYDTTGLQTWSLLSAGPTTLSPRGVAVTTDGVFFGGTHEGSSDIAGLTTLVGGALVDGFAFGVDDGGSMLQFGFSLFGAGDDAINGVDARAGLVFLVGSFDERLDIPCGRRLTTQGGTDAFYAVLTDAGAAVQCGSIGGPGDDLGMAISASCDSIYLSLLVGSDHIELDTGEGRDDVANTLSIVRIPRATPGPCL